MVEPVVDTLEYIESENPYLNKHRNHSEPPKKISAIKLEFEDLDEEDYEEKDNIPGKLESGCQVVSLIFPDGSSSMMIVNEDQDTLESLRYRLAIKAKEQRRVRSYTTDVNIASLQFSYESRNTIHQIPQNLERMTFKDLLNVEKIKDNINNECLVLYFAANENKKHDLLQIKDHEILREKVEISLNGLNEFKEQILVINPAEDVKKTEIMILNMNGEQDTYLKLKDIFNIEILQEQQLLIIPNIE